MNLIARNRNQNNKINAFSSNNPLMEQRAYNDAEDK